MKKKRWSMLALAAIAACAPKAAQRPAGEVAITVTDEGFQPERVTVPKGAPVTLVFTRKSDQTCATDVTFARLGKSYPLPLNKSVRVPRRHGHARLRVPDGHVPGHDRGGEEQQLSA